MQQAYFRNHVRVPFRDYTNLSKHGVQSRGRNFYLNADSAQDLPKLGVWHILPESLSREMGVLHPRATGKDFEKCLTKDDSSIVVYLHGPAGDRTTKHRCELYNVLSNMGFHVLALDYRGYGDSTGCPSEDGLTQDALAIYNYARQMAPARHIFVWGHSMGSAITAKIARQLSLYHAGPTGIVLESPFTSIKAAIRGHPVGRAIRRLSFGRRIVDKWVIRSLTDSGLELSTDMHVFFGECPILVLHAEDDHIVPVKSARKLVETAKVARISVTYAEFEARHKFKHENIHRAEELPDIIRDFTNTAINLADAEAASAFSSDQSQTSSSGSSLVETSEQISESHRKNANCTVQ